MSQDNDNENVPSKETQDLPHGIEDMNGEGYLCENIDDLSYDNEETLSEASSVTATSFQLLKAQTKVQVNAEDFPDSIDFVPNGDAEAPRSEEDVNIDLEASNGNDNAKIIMQKNGINYEEYDSSIHNSSENTSDVLYHSDAKVSYLKIQAVDIQSEADRSFVENGAENRDHAGSNDIAHNNFEGIEQSAVYEDLPHGDGIKNFETTATAKTPFENTLISLQQESQALDESIVNIQTDESKDLKNSQEISSPDPNLSENLDDDNALCCGSFNCGEPSDTLANSEHSTFEGVDENFTASENEIPVHVDNNPDHFEANEEIEEVNQKYADFDEEQTDKSDAACAKAQVDVPPNASDQEKGEGDFSTFEDFTANASIEGGNCTAVSDDALGSEAQVDEIPNASVEEDDAVEEGNCTTASDTNDDALGSEAQVDAIPNASVEEGDCTAASDMNDDALGSKTQVDAIPKASVEEEVEDDIVAGNGSLKEAEKIGEHTDNGFNALDFASDRNSTSREEDAEVEQEIAIKVLQDTEGNSGDIDEGNFGAFEDVTVSTADVFTVKADIEGNGHNEVANDLNTEEYFEGFEDANNIKAVEKKDADSGSHSSDDSEFGDFGDFEESGHQPADIEGNEQNEVANNMNADTNSITAVEKKDADSGSQSPDDSEFGDFGDFEESAHQPADVEGNEHNEVANDMNADTNSITAVEKKDADSGSQSSDDSEFGDFGDFEESGHQPTTKNSDQSIFVQNTSSLLNNLFKSNFEQHKITTDTFTLDGHSLRNALETVSNDSDWLFDLSASKYNHLENLFDYSTVKENPSNVFVDDSCPIRCHERFIDREHGPTFHFETIVKEMYEVVELDLPTLSDVAEDNFVSSEVKSRYEAPPSIIEQASPRNEQPSIVAARPELPSLQCENISSDSFSPRGELNIETPSNEEGQANGTIQSHFASPTLVQMPVKKTDGNTRHESIDNNHLKDSHDIDTLPSQEQSMAENQIVEDEANFILEPQKVDVFSVFDNAFETINTPSQLAQTEYVLGLDRNGSSQELDNKSKVYDAPHDASSDDSFGDFEEFQGPGEHNSLSQEVKPVIPIPLDLSFQDSMVQTVSNDDSFGDFENFQGSDERDSFAKEGNVRKVNPEDLNTTKENEEHTNTTMPAPLDVPSDTLEKENPDSIIPADYNDDSFGGFEGFQGSEEQDSSTGERKIQKLNPEYPTTTMPARIDVPFQHSATLDEGMMHKDPPAYSNFEPPALKSSVEETDEVIGTNINKSIFYPTANSENDPFDSMQTITSTKCSLVGTATTTQGNFSCTNLPEFNAPSESTIYMSGQPEKEIADNINMPTPQEGYLDQDFSSTAAQYDGPNSTNASSYAGDVSSMKPFESANQPFLTIPAINTLTEALPEPTIKSNEGTFTEFKTDSRNIFPNSPRITTMNETSYTNEILNQGSNNDGFSDDEFGDFCAPKDSNTAADSTHTNGVMTNKSSSSGNAISDAFSIFD